MWDSDFQKQVNDLKEAVSKNACVNYYTTTVQLSLEVDASQKFLGEVLIQDGRPIMFVSITLTKWQPTSSYI